MTVVRLKTDVAAPHQKITASGRCVFVCVRLQVEEEADQFLLNFLAENDKEFCLLKQLLYDVCTNR